MKNLTTILSVSTLMLGLALTASTAFAQTATYSTQLDIGSTGPEVTQLQQFLAQNTSIYPQGLVTGYFGALTSAAVARWQAANGISAVGRVGPVTLAALNNANGGGTLLSGASSPILTLPNTSGITRNSVSIAWTSNVAANALVMYGTSWPFLFSAAPSASGSSDSNNQNVTLNGLSPNTTYYFVVQSTDSSGNYSYWYPVGSFTTQP